MEKKEVVGLLRYIVAVYPHFELSDDLVKVWIDLMKDVSYTETFEKLKVHCKTNKFPPKPAELMYEEKSNGPTVNGTKHLFKQWDEESKDIAAPEEKEKHLNEIAKILGIRRNA
ncbi:replicative helicase loader/inhibitor [Bacillus cereus]|uniref:replicative helicase loader/inhibitor n=1 Tax=Bacillus cereus TaxID=1396 RepID=UPI00240CF493|nr:replicative helicase loader/inhibitor [Bacillus cereus]MDG1596096.1 replicative helicase loader/inhibitor [Bacillus cereus]